MMFLLVGCKSSEDRQMASADSFAQSLIAHAESSANRTRLNDSLARAAQLADTVPERAEVLVCVERGSSLRTYRYKVRNMTKKQGVVWMLGFGTEYPDDPAADSMGGADLMALPLHARYDADVQDLRPEGYTVPPHWRAELSRVEETAGFLIEFLADTTPKYGIPANSSLAGFSVTVPRGDSAYVVGRWKLLVLAPGDFAGRLRQVPCDSVR
jgi:hypothetical protein